MKMKLEINMNPIFYILLAIQAISAVTNTTNSKKTNSMRVGIYADEDPRFLRWVFFLKIIMKSFR